MIKFKRHVKIPHILKKSLYILFIFINLPLFLLYKTISPIFGKEKVFHDLSQFVSLIPGIIGEYFRFGFYRLTLKALGENTCISFGTLFSSPDTIVGKGVYFGPNCNIGLSKIGNDVLLGSGVHIISGRKQHGIARLDIPIREQPGELIPVTIGQDCWLGNNAVIGADVQQKCIVGAGSIVTKNIPAFSIALGNPAKVAKSREHK